MLLPLLALIQAIQTPIQSFYPPSVSQTRIVMLRHGDIYISDPHELRRVTTDGRCSSVVKSPDGKLIAFIHMDVPPGNEGDQGQTSLRIADLASGEVRQVLAPTPSTEPERDMRSMDRPKWSLEGGFIYVESAAWATSSAIHQVNLATGRERFVIDGWLNAIVRTGPYRGYLLVGRHQYRQGPGGGSFNPVYLVRPDGKVMFAIAGSADDEGERSVPKWLSANGWRAS